MSQTSYGFTQGKAFAGMIDSTFDNEVVSKVQAEASASIPFGVGLAKGTGDQDAILPAASGAKFIGILLHSHVYAHGSELDAVGVKPKNTLNVLEEGRCWVFTETAVVAYDRAYMRYAAGAGGTQLGAFRNSAVANETIDVTSQVRFVDSASANTLVRVAIDDINK